LKSLFKVMQLIIPPIFIVVVSIVNIQVVYAKETNTHLVSSRVQLENALLAHKGKVVYVDFWASWCVPCRKSFPWMNTIQEKYKAQGFNVISINLDANKTLADKFLINMPAMFPVIYDPKGKIAKHFKIQGMPSSMLIGRDGTIKSRHTGFFIKKIPEYQQEIEEFLAEKFNGKEVGK